MVAPENRVVQADGAAVRDPQRLPKPKAGSRLKASRKRAPSWRVLEPIIRARARQSVKKRWSAEATRLLKGVSPRALRFEDCEGNLAWIRSDPDQCFEPRILPPGFRSYKCA